MMKRLLSFLLIFFYFSNNMFAQNEPNLAKTFPNFDSVILGSSGEYGGYAYQLQNQELIIFDRNSGGEYATNVTISKLKFDKELNCYYFILRETKCFLIPGEKVFFVSTGSDGIRKGISMNSVTGTPYKIDSDFFKRKLYNGVPVDNRPLNDCLRFVKSSSNYNENYKQNVISYDGYNLDKYLLFSFFGNSINPYCFPWVENAEGTGIGEWIEFDLKSPQSVTYILNGFVDGTRLHLYKANSRMKTALITGTTESGKIIEQEVHFEDFVYFKTVKFEKPVTKFRITIKETYAGDKWQDTAISAVMFPIKNGEN